MYWWAFFRLTTKQLPWWSQQTFNSSNVTETSAPCRRERLPDPIALKSFCTGQFLDFQPQSNWKVKYVSLYLNSLKTFKIISFRLYRFWRRRCGREKKGKIMQIPELRHFFNASPYMKNSPNCAAVVGTEAQHISAFSVRFYSHIKYILKPQKQRINQCNLLLTRWLISKIWGSHSTDNTPWNLPGNDAVWIGTFEVFDFFVWSGLFWALSIA
jgi:hypothetical protein